MYRYAVLYREFEFKGEITMKIIEFIEYMQKNTTRTMRDDQIQQMVQRVLEVKTYLGIKEKRDLIDNVINECILYENGVYKFDGIAKYVYLTMYTIAAYTNLELSDDVEIDFDMLSEAKLLPIVVGVMQEEYNDVNILFQMQCDTVLAGNSVEALMGKLVGNVSVFLDDVINSFKKMTDFDANKILDVLQSFQGVDH